MTIFWKRWTRPWLKRNYKEKIFIMEVKYIINHLTPRWRDYILTTDNNRSKYWIQQLDKGINPLSIEPIQLRLNGTLELFEFVGSGGRHRLIAFRKCKKLFIKALVDTLPNFVYD